MMLTDTGPLVALVDENDFHHGACKQAAAVLSELLLATTWPCMTEAMYLLGKLGEYQFQSRLWELYQTDELQVLELTESEVERMQWLMKKYKDRPMDLADASLMAVAEARGYKQVFTLDSDFRIYRLAGGSVLEVVP